MEFSKWLLKKGFGSVGSTTKTWTKVYLDYISDINDEDKKETGFMHVIMTYTLANKKMRQYHSTDPTLLIDKSEGCLAMLMWILICEIPSNVKAILSDEKAFDISNEVVYQCVMEQAPHEILKTPSQFRIKALEYLDYRDNLSKALEANKHIQETKYRTATTNRLDKKMEIFEDNLFSDAKERFISLSEKNNPEDFIIWTMEMNSNKYVYAHLCNDISFKRNINLSAKNLSGKIQFPGIDY